MKLRTGDRVVSDKGLRGKERKMQFLRDLS